ncbi:MAG: 16S rRNA (cytidine(1402)-2'-O)-methyltransferase [Candidatus Margulisiibacteriota bacterium]
MPQKANSSTGTLYIVGTPLGNLEDISARAVKVLAGADLIAAEDTRCTGILLKENDIRVPQTSYHDHNKDQKSKQLIKELLQGRQIALVTDAGMPGISDPGYVLVKDAIAAGVKVVPVPGPSAVTCALSISGFPTDRFIFEGFLDRKSGKRRKQLEALKDEKRTLVFYESPHRLLKMLQDVEDTFGERRLCIARELTKKYEEILYLTTREAIIIFTNKNPKGEFTIVIEGSK